MNWSDYMEWEKQEIMRLLAGRPGTIYQESSEEEKAIFRRWIKDVLNTGVTTIEFVKNDGTVRTMKATLDSTYIVTPTVSTVAVAEGNVREVKKNDEVCKVWDAEAEAWRSFRYDRIKRISLELG